MKKIESIGHLFVYYSKSKNSVRYYQRVPNPPEYTNKYKSLSYTGYTLLQLSKWKLADKNNYIEDTLKFSVSEVNSNSLSLSSKSLEETYFENLIELPNWMTLDIFEVYDKLEKILL